MEETGAMRGGEVEGVGFLGGVVGCVGDGCREEEGEVEGFCEEGEVRG